MATLSPATGAAGASWPTRHGARPAYAPAQATTAFGLDLMRRLPSGNLVLSPDSIETALAMAGTGAEGQTAKQMADALRLPSPRSFAAVGALQREIAGEQVAAGAGHGDAPVLNLAGALFLQDGLRVEPSFLSGLESAFGARPQRVDFRHALAAAEAAIDVWGGEQTHGLIPKAVSGLPTETLLAIVNAIYLKAQWATPFQASATTPDAFHLKGGAVQVPFMHETETLRYGAGRGYELVELPYAASDLTMAALLPVGESVTRLLDGLTEPALSAMLARTSPRAVALSIPRFQFSFAQELNGALRSLGMADAFTSAANFHGIAPGLDIGAVQHVADIAVDEEGTEAAAVTVLAIEESSLRVLSHPVSFDADRPFLFFVRDRRSGATLFAGRVEDPAGS